MIVITEWIEDAKKYIYMKRKRNIIKIITYMYDILLLTR